MVIGGWERIRVLMTFQLNYFTTFRSKYFATYAFWKLSGQNMVKNVYIRIFFPISVIERSGWKFRGGSLRVLIMFQLTYSTTFMSKYFATYDVFKLSGRNMVQNATQKLHPLYRKILTLSWTQNLIPPRNRTRWNVFVFVSNQYLNIWFYLLLSTCYLEISLYRAGITNVL